MDKQKKIITNLIKIFEQLVNCMHCTKVNGDRIQTWISIKRCANSKNGISKIQLSIANEALKEWNFIYFKMKILVVLSIVLTASTATALRRSNQDDFQLVGIQNCPIPTEPFEIEGKFIIPAIYDWLVHDGFNVTAKALIDRERDALCFIFKRLFPDGKLPSGEKIKSFKILIVYQYQRIWVVINILWIKCVECDLKDLR